MTEREALQVVRCLAEGLDPYTNIPLPDDSVCQRSRSVRALQLAVEALERAVSSSERRGRASNAGKPWTAEEDAALLSAFDAGLSIADIAGKHQRSRGAITARLVRAGKLDSDQHRFSISGDDSAKHPPAAVANATYSNGDSV
ncbi:MAG: hypothetical protein KDD69_08505 [Bdellovibrionales bacterium]|nr:hypothetical protein [Bdellovibrionales bacterium]